jgi:hypothetical protein
MASPDIPDELFDAALRYRYQLHFIYIDRLTVNLCQPTIIAFNGKAPEDNEDWKLYYELEENLRKALGGFRDTKIFQVFLAKIKGFFELVYYFRVLCTIKCINYLGLGCSYREDETTDRTNYSSDTLYFRPRF